MNKYHLSSEVDQHRNNHYKNIDTDTPKSILRYESDSEDEMLEEAEHESGSEDRDAVRDEAVILNENNVDDMLGEAEYINDNNDDNVVVKRCY